MFKTVKDIADDVKNNGIELQSKVSPEVRAHAQAIRPGLKELQMYVDKLSGLSFADLLSEYDAASNSLVEIDVAARKLTEDFKLASEIYQAAMQKNTNKREIEALRIAAVGEALRTIEIKPVAASNLAPVKKKVPNQDYVECLMYEQNNRAKVKRILLDEGYDPESVKIAVSKLI